MPFETIVIQSPYEDTYMHTHTCVLSHPIIFFRWEITGVISWGALLVHIIYRPLGTHTDTQGAGGAF
jgi:hypothetical protein